MNDTIRYYDQNADDFVAGTLQADMSEARDRFLDLLQPGTLILDLGCGSGRDSKAFLEQGYQVEAIDGSQELCAAASRLTDLAVRHLTFDQLQEIEKYDGIWACASLLHVPKSEMPSILVRIKAALKPHGIVYISVKEGEFDGLRKGRHFADYREEEFVSLLEAQKLEIIEHWISEDVRPDRSEHWINVLARRA
ncbi:MAG: class I SAM-dependent methyltransferase [Clostridia bacterium]|nr:class I SAM-dependent methyltransferase [Clostridia bacterium]